MESWFALETVVRQLSANHPIDEPTSRCGTGGITIRPSIRQRVKDTSTSSHGILGRSGWDCDSIVMRSGELSQAHELKGAPSFQMDEDTQPRPSLRSNFRSRVGSGELRLTRAAHQRRVVT